jgi:hypothetical protein
MRQRSGTVELNAVASADDIVSSEARSRSNSTTNSEGVSEVSDDAG